MIKRKSFFERLTGGIRMQDEDAEDFFDEDPQEIEEKIPLQEEEEGQLAVDVYQNDRAIIIKAMTAGVRKEDLDISITREMVTIRGRRSSESIIDDDNYYHQELYWGSFSRTIMLPEEIDVEEVEATEDHGLLTITLPKKDKNREIRVKVR